MIDWLLAGARWGQGTLVWTTEAPVVIVAVACALAAWSLALFGGWQQVRSRPVRLLEAGLWCTT